MISPTLPIIKKWAGTASRLWHWWTGELRDIIPSQLRAAAHARTKLHIYSSKNGLIVESVIAGNGQKLTTEQDFDNLDDDAWQQIVELCIDQKPEVFLDSSKYYSIDLNLPRASRGYLEQAISLQMNIHCPLDPALVDWAVIEKSVIGNDLTATLIFAKRGKLDKIEESFLQYGIAPPAIGVENNGAPIMLRRGHDVTSTGGHFSKPRNIYWIACLILLTTPISISLAAKVMFAANQADIAKMEQYLRGKMANDRLASRYEADRQKLASITQIPSLGRYLEIISDLLPDGSYISSITMDQSGLIRFSVSGPDGNDMIERLLTSDKFKDANLVDETTDEEQSRYTVEALVK